MKKVMFVLVCLLLVSTMAFALESGPSNKVGYVKLTCTPGYTSFGLPFVFWYVPSGNVPTYGTESRKPSSIVGSQANMGTIGTADRVIEQGGLGAYAYRLSPAGTWTGSLETQPAAMAPAKAYYYWNRTGTNRTIVLAGEADTTATGIPTVAVNPAPSATVANYVPYSWRDPREVTKDRLNLLANGFRGGTISTSDRVFEQGGSGRSFYYTTSWQGTLPSVTPGVAYWIANKHTLPTYPGWNYTYNASGAGLSMPNRDGKSDVQRVEQPLVKTSTAKTRTATK